MFSFIKVLGEVMITQIGGPDTISVAKDPRRKSQSLKFNSHAEIPSNPKVFKNSMDTYNGKSPIDKAFWTSIYSVLGAVLLVGGVLTLTAAKDARLR